MKKILFLTTSYPNARRSATMLCTHRVMECVASSGYYEVHALCNRYKGELAEETVYGIHIHRFLPSLWMQWQHNVENDSPRGKKHRKMELIQKTLTIPTFPINRPLTTALYIHAAKRLQQKERFDIVVSEHHFIETLLTGCKLMKKFDVLKHVALLWDPVKGQIATTNLPKSFTDKRILRIEEFVTKYTTLQISTASMKAYHLKQGDISADHRIYLDIPSVLMPEPEVPTEHLKLVKEGAINILFSGRLSSLQRDPLPIIRLLNKCDDAEKINLLFFSIGAGGVIEKFSKQFRGKIVCHDYIPLNELHTIYRHVDFLLNISHINANMVPSKIFEYMSFGKPIISTYLTEGDAAQNYLTCYPESISIDLKKNENENITLLNAFLKTEHNIVPFEEVKKRFKDNTPDTYLDTINKIVFDK